MANTVVEESECGVMDAITERQRRAQRSMQTERSRVQKLLASTSDRCWHCLRSTQHHWHLLQLLYGAEREAVRERYKISRIYDSVVLAYAEPTNVHCQ